ncbi:MAG: AhpC/TSA family protein, partial [Opitutae bacterium]|nr:AhpC/TSA family protein [Opitutae bacterium]
AATAVTPLPVGAKAPAVMVKSVEGADLALPDILAQKPTLLIFYRGSWCPYCNKHLAALAEIEPRLLALGCQIVALSPDEAAGLRQMAGKNHLNYRLFSDRAMQAASAFGVAFRVDDKTVKAYTGYGITLPPVPGEAGTHWLPVPAVYVIGRDGTVKFVHADPDYKVRLSAEAVVAAAKSAL